MNSCGWNRKFAGLELHFTCGILIEILEEIHDNNRIIQSMWVPLAGAFGHDVPSCLWFFRLP